MNLEQKVGQLLIIGFNGKSVPLEIKELIHKFHIGGIILFGRNIGTPAEVLALTTELQQEARKAGYIYPLLICVDQENGVVRRLGEEATVFPGAMALGATADSDNAYKTGIATGEELKALGINWNLAPVSDVNNNPDNPVIGVRSFGESPEKVSQFASAMMRGMQDAGIATTIKHFPGHGDTDTDSHLDLPVIKHNLERLEEIELKPFRACIDMGADTIMTAHVYFPAIEKIPGIPATISKKVITGLLRESLGFNGVVTTDCMEMNAILNGVGTEKGSVAALKAGVDLVMISHTIERQIGALKEIIRAVENGELDENVIDQANVRINRLKEKYLSWEETFLKESFNISEFVGSKQHQRLAHELYQKSVTIVKNNGILPIHLNAKSSILVIHPDNGTTMQVEDKRYASLKLGKAIQEYDPTADIQQISSSLTDKTIADIVKGASRYEFVIVGTLTVIPDDYQIKLVEKLLEKDISTVVIGMRSPYDFAYLPDVPAYINTYEFTYPALKVAAAAVFGKIEVSGKSPVTVTNLKKAYKKKDDF